MRSRSWTVPWYPPREHRLATPSKNYRHSTNVQVAIDAETRLVISTGDPQLGSRNDCTVNLNATHRKVRGRVEHALSRMKLQDPPRLPPRGKHSHRHRVRDRQPVQTSSSLSECTTSPTNHNASYETALK
jgi:hypothetical protein